MDPDFVLYPMQRAGIYNYEQHGMDLNPGDDLNQGRLFLL